MSPRGPFEASLASLALVVGALAARAHQDGAPELVTLDAASATDVTGEGRAFVELELDPAAPFESEPVVVCARFGIEESFLEDGLVQPFRRSLDVPVQLELGGPGAWPGVALVESFEGMDSSGPSFALGSRVGHARALGIIERDGRRFAGFELEALFEATRPGGSTLPAPVVRFAWTTRFETDVFGAATPVDRLDGFVRGEPLALVVRPLPAEQRPLDFSGAVGSLTVTARVGEGEIRAGEPFRLELTFEGRANRGWTPPDLGRLAGFTERSRRELPAAAGRRFLYELVPKDPAVFAVPPIELSYFEVGPPARYRTIRTEPLPIRVAATSEAPARQGGSEPPSGPVTPADGGAERSPALWLFLGALLALGAVLLHRVRARASGA